MYDFLEILTLNEDIKIQADRRFNSVLHILHHLSKVILVQIVKIINKLEECPALDELSKNTEQNGTLCSTISNIST